jgi:hypothetical protein
MPNIQPPRNGLQEFKERYRIPGAQFWSVDDVATKGESVRNLPHMMPDEKTFAEAAGEETTFFASVPKDVDQVDLSRRARYHE